METVPVEKVIWRMSQHYNDMGEFRLADAYKMAYQGCMGPEHAITGPNAVRQWLDKEWDKIEANSSEGLYVDLSIHQPIYRINLRTAKFFEITKDQIHDEFLNLAKIFPRRPDLLREIWAELTAQIKAGKELVCNPQELAEFNRTIEENDYPAVHHSLEYREINKPSYRLVDEIIG